MISVNQQRTDVATNVFNDVVDECAMELTKRTKKNKKIKKTEKILATYPLDLLGKRAL